MFNGKAWLVYTTESRLWAIGLQKIPHNIMHVFFCQQRVSGKRGALSHYNNSLYDQNLLEWRTSHETGTSTERMSKCPCCVALLHLTASENLLDATWHQMHCRSWCFSLKFVIYIFYTEFSLEQQPGPFHGLLHWVQFGHIGRQGLVMTTGRQMTSWLRNSTAWGWQSHQV